MPFEFKDTKLSGLKIIIPGKFPDDRGFFMETYKKSEFFAAGIKEEFVQDNHSYSTKGVLRGIHFQREPHAQGKLVRVIDGKVLDVAVDLRQNSPTFKQWIGVELDGETGIMLYLPPGFGHGFLVLSETAHFLYKCTAEYNKMAEGSVRWDDPDLAIKWPDMEIKVSRKDSDLPELTELVKKGLL